jgi:hypothetical protein
MCSVYKIKNFTYHNLSNKAKTKLDEIKTKVKHGDIICGYNMINESLLVVDENELVNCMEGCGKVYYKIPKKITMKIEDPIKFYKNVMNYKTACKTVNYPFIQELELHKNIIEKYTTFNPDYEYIYSVSEEKEIYVYDYNNKKLYNGYLMSIKV